MDLNTSSFSEHFNTGLPITVNDKGFVIDPDRKEAKKVIYDPATSQHFMVRVLIEGLTGENLDRRLSKYSDDWCLRQKALTHKMTDPAKNPNKSLKTVEVYEIISP